MGTEKSVFASNLERKNFYKLSRVWSEKYRLYHNLPFLSVFNTNKLFDWISGKEIMLDDFEINRLKKTSIDYTLCDETDSPILCIEFDGLQQGYNIGQNYHPQEIIPSKAAWRRTITELKLKVAHGSFFPFFVVNSSYFDDLSNEIKLTIIDGVIGDIIASKKVREKVEEGFMPDEVGWDNESFESLSPFEQHEVIQDWLLGVEVEAEMENNPISKKRYELQEQLKVTSYSYEFLVHPDLADKDYDLSSRASLTENAELKGARAILHTKDFGKIEATAWIANFKTPFFLGLGLLENIAFIVAMEKLNSHRKKAV